MTTPRNSRFESLKAESPGTVAAFREAAGGRSDTLVDLGVGDPRAVMDPAVRLALVEGIPEISSYPLATGIAQVREAVARWARRTYGTIVDPESEVVPTHGSKEAINSLTTLCLDRESRNTVVTTDPGYPTPLHAARLLGAECHTLPIEPGNDFLPDLDSVPATTWARTAILWLNYPNNPTAAVATRSLFDQAATLAARHGFLFASDEAYAEVYADVRPFSALELNERASVAVVTSLSKRSGLTGLRAGAVLGPAELIRDLRRIRAMTGVAPQVFTQQAAAAAWDDDTHAASLRHSLMERTRLLHDACSAAGLETYGGDASPFLWVAVPRGGDDADFCRSLVDRGVLVTPGSFFGTGGRGFVRIAAMAPPAECERAAVLIRELDFD